MRARRTQKTEMTASIHPLESRRLLAGFGTGFAAKFNFQPRGTVPDGYVADVGTRYAKQGAYTYGWDVDNGAFMLDRHTDAKIRYDTLAQLDTSDSTKPSGRRWEVAVPNGLYRVSVTAGDAKYVNSRYVFAVEGTSILNSKPTNASHWRTGEGLVDVTDGRLTLVSGAGAINNKVNSIDIRQVDPHALAPGEAEVANPFSLASMVQNEVDVDAAIPMMQALGTKNVKLWYPIRDWDDAPTAKEFKRMAKYKKAGFSLTVTFHNRDVPTVEQAHDFFARVAAYPGAIDLIDFWQIGNEPNLEAFWTGTPQQFVDTQLAPAYSVLRPLGEPVVGGGVTYDVPYIENIMTLGYANYVDYGGFHPYHQTGQQVVDRAIEAKAAFGGLPMIVSEWNVVWSEWDPAGFAREIAIAARGLRDVAYMNFYFALEVSDTHVGSAGAYKHDHTPNGAIYEVIDSWT